MGASICVKRDFQPPVFMAIGFKARGSRLWKTSNLGGCLFWWLQRWQQGAWISPTLGEQLASSTKEKTPLSQGHWSRFSLMLSSQFRTGWLVNQEEATIKQSASKSLLVSCY